MQLTIEKLIYGGDGLARLPSGDAARAGKAVFVPFTIPGERVEARIVEEKPGFARARVEQIVERSPERIEPGCPYFGECGGCQYQHLDYDGQLRAKSAILRETLQRTAKIDPPEIVTHASPPWNYRNRTRMRVRTGAEFAIGYHRFASHALLPVRECPISSPLINRALAAIWKLGERGAVPSAASEIEFFVNAEDAEAMLEITLAQGQRRVLRELAIFADALRAELPELAGVVPFVEEGRSVRRLDVPVELEKSFGRDSLLYRAGGMQYQVSAGSFFQTNRYLVDTMIALATAGASGGYALDLYAGVGLFTLPLSQNFREVAAVEIAPFSFHDLTANELASVTGYRTRVDTFLLHVPEGTRFDYVVVDPPRGGLGEAIAHALGNLKAPRITYVSCDPATFARDLKVLGAAGYKVESLHLLDLFPQTFHIETVAHLIL
ncbi:MAG: 23S rRNA (uracil(1939)-C(5))-methyltransferase RlmD [Terriglobales bacterium]